jgi:hypothetical protein
MDSATSQRREGLFPGFPWELVPPLSRWRVFRGAILAGLVLTAPIVPLEASIAAVLHYLGGLQGAAGRDALSFGLQAGLLSWIPLALAAVPFTSIERASARNYETLDQFARTLEARLSCSLTDLSLAEHSVAYSEAKAHLDSLRPMLDGRDRSCADRIRWSLGSGYVDLWNRVHRAEEALIQLQAPAELVRDGLDDLLRLYGSTIPERDRLTAILREALVELDPSMRTHAALFMPTGGSGAAHTAADPPVAEHKSIAQAQMQFVRRGINNFRDSRRDGLVYARNQLLWILGCVGVMQFVIIGVAVTVEALPEAIMVATSCYLVGAITGIFALLHTAATSVQGVEDFGLGAVRVLSRPTHAGIAGFLGVIVVRLAPVAADLASAVANRPGDLNVLLSWDQLPANLILAGIFGLTPGLLFRRFHDLTEQMKLDLKTTQSSEAARN